ncbi:hypothetical protein [Shimia abyssi]|uniref:Uncharacterized protein n=1 Tax=Shimia abyssi TaxID=1662395 RepID=A0A2P8FHU4_9RHOB|nr:hypothetical protein [Shimia abyssi]PSL21275.1 hypothetical protein CLV88_102395 [Shimia abyssi]
MTSTGTVAGPKSEKKIVLILGSGPNAPETRTYARGHFTNIVAINNAWRIREDWTHLIHPEDFPSERRPRTWQDDQTLVDYTDYIPQQNRYGGVIYAGGTMAFTAGYWALGALQPDIMAFMGCDMVYPSQGKTHFYGTGAADPLRDDITLQSLEAKSARLWFHAAQSGCACVNLSNAESRLVFPRSTPDTLSHDARVTKPRAGIMTPPLAKEAALNYRAPTGRYWEMLDQFHPSELAHVDRLWREAWQAASIVVA